MVQSMDGVVDTLLRRLFVGLNLLCIDASVPVL